MKLIRQKFKGGHQYWFYCPACHHAHSFTVGCEGVHANWTYDPATVTFSPSLRVYTADRHTGRGDVTHCHLFVKGGWIEFCADCPHPLANTKQDLPEFPEGYGLTGPYEIVA